MTYTAQKLLTFETFLAQYCDNPRYELADGELVDMEPTGPQETVGGKLATQIGIAITTEKLPWFIPRTCLIRPFADAATARHPDIVVLDETVLASEPLWQREPAIALGLTSTYNYLTKSLQILLNTSASPKKTGSLGG